MNEFAHSPTIRRAELRDLDALIELEHRSFTTDHLSRAQFRRHLRSESAAVIVAVATDGTLLGDAVVFFRRNSDSARLYSIVVAHEARGQRLGERLLAAAEQASIDHGRGHLRLEVRQDNHGAMRLYDRLGYTRFGALRGFYEDGADAWRYEKHLTR